jgi:sugar phosphate isomerase/epimerase
MRALSTRARAVVAVSVGAILLGAAVAAPTAPGQAAAPDAAGGECDGSIPDSKIGIQLWNFSAYVGFGSDPATQQRAEEVLAGLSEMGYRNVEPFTFNGRTATEFKALLDKYDLKAPSRHGSTDEATWDAHLADAKVLGQKFVGSGGFAAPGIGSYEDTLATAETMNRLGRRSVRNGTGRIFGHNHQGEFRTTYVDPDTGETKSAWQIIVENTNPRYVTFQLDVLWATDGGADPVELLNRYGDRIVSLHVKDGINVADPANATPVPMGDGEMVFEPILAAAEDHVRYYIYEQDPPFGDPTFDPFASAQKGIDYLDCVTF